MLVDFRYFVSLSEISERVSVLIGTLGWGNINICWGLGIELLVIKELEKRESSKKKICHIFTESWKLTISGATS